MQRKLSVPNPDGMPGIVTTVVANDCRESPRQEVYDLALALVAPLSANDHHRLLIAHTNLRLFEPISSNGSYKKTGQKNGPRSRAVIMIE
jgi:hypothetical protein